MEIRKKIIFETIILSIILALLSFVIINNILIIQNNFSYLDNELIPSMTILKDIRSIASNILVSTLEFSIVEEEITPSGNDEASKSNQKLTEVITDIDLSKSQFDEMSSLYKKQAASINMLSIEKIEQRWQEFELLSDKFIEYKKRGISGDELIKIKDEFRDSKDSLFKEIDLAIIFNEEKIQEKRNAVEELVRNTTILIFTILIICISTIVIIRYHILKSILIPILKLRKTVQEIAKGDFRARIDVSQNDEMGELLTDINQMAQDLESAQKELLKHEKISNIGMLAARMAHDILNPLSNIKIGAEYLRSRIKREEKEIKTLDIIDRAVDRISFQVQDVLNFVKTDSLEITKASLLELLKQVIKNQTIPETVNYTLPENDIKVFCDYKKIEVVFINLLRNSIDAINAQGTIKVRFIDLGDKVRIEFEDSGKGVSEEHKTRIFEPLFTTKQKGTGLGLTSVKTIIEQHGGSITFSNNPTVFSIILPKNQHEKQ
ncbi:sensor histidine kinase [Candidatus Nitrosotenuis chungbukensis]|uniref:sensor histidine kinase n=2 Tax=Candidatus Nitrosotenuis chungbukensis TaxID=1353246 RepID=UPI000693A0E4|nr:HAMP domain-containing sensor histidine kinase [Candidatus Nitrosotenuis chungbukensis]